MKNLVLIVLTIIALNSSFSQSLKGRVTYQATIIGDASFDFYDDEIDMPEEFKDLEIKSGKDAVPINFHLLFDGNESMYKSEYDMMETKQLGLLMNQTNLVGRQSQIYYTNLKTKEKIFRSHWTQHVLVNMDDIDWNLTQETKQIGKYTAYKATATITSEQTYGMNFLSPVEAWYTTQVPVSFGIQTFVGLPGLTLELTVHYEEGKIHYSAIEIELNPKDGVDIEKPIGKQRMTELEYVEMIKELNARR